MLRTESRGRKGREEGKGVWGRVCGGQAGGV